MRGVHQLRVGHPNIVWRYLLTMFPSFEVRIPATRATATGSAADPIKYSGFGMRMQRWRNTKGLKDWRSKARREEKLSGSMAGPPIAAAMARIERNMHPCSYDPYLSVNHGGTQASPVSYPFELQQPPRSCWSTSTSAGFNELANTNPYVPHNDGYQNMASPAPRAPREPLVNPRSATWPANSGHYNVPYSRYAAPRSTQIYGGQKNPMEYATDLTSAFHQRKVNTGTDDSVFLNLDFRNTPPRTAAEIDFVTTLLQYTRTDYKSWMNAEPPPTNALSSYADQYREIQAHLEQSWPDPYNPPVKLRALGPISGDLNQ